ncbi:uncharacterized protein [Montipora capricornis]|uniref:uncharacterized protein n=1 Tax=Montipora capricornis TaxID=246305 RepID=UPI0035F1645B
MCGLPLRFRLHKVVLFAVVEKAFLQVGLQPNDRDVTRFIWLKDPSKPTLENNVQGLRFTRVPFGMISSPFLLAATIKNHLTTAGIPIAHQIADNMYVDNMITGVKTSTQADELYKGALTLFQLASVNLLEWASNSSEFLQNIPECDRIRNHGSPRNLLEFDHRYYCHQWVSQSLLRSENKKKKKHCSLPAESTIHWAPFLQSLRMPSCSFRNCGNDPLGLFSPVTPNAKLFIQELWEQEKDWDETFSQSHQQV